MSFRPSQGFLHCRNALNLKAPASKLSSQPAHVYRFLHIDGRSRLSGFWAPTSIKSSGEEDDSNSLLLRAGYLRQAHSGVFHLLPLGLRVQDKLERLIDKHMKSLGASKVSLSSITSEELWRRSGRFQGHSELLALKDRRQSGFLLSPTHEEEITTLVAGIVQSYKDLPLRVYQISRKYRDERRPRQGLLRAKEFLMKDLYTFDHTIEEALSTYSSTRKAYSAFFDELKLPYLVAEADSGNMGGKLSHEYHFVSEKGEDQVISCNSCNYVANEELAEKGAGIQGQSSIEPLEWTGISKDKSTLVRVYVPQLPRAWPTEQAINNLNIHVLKSVFPEIDTTIEKNAAEIWESEGAKDPQKRLHIVQILDHRVPPSAISSSSLTPPGSSSPEASATIKTITSHPSTSAPLDLTPIVQGDHCSRCATGTLNVQRAIEVGHTFYLGTRYSEPLDADVSSVDSAPVPMQMGCHGIGVSRMIAAIAAILRDERGLNWPRAVAPFEAIVIPGPAATDEDTVRVYDALRSAKDDGNVDALIDDREKPMGWKLKDADLIGYPVVVVLGRAWKKEGKVEVQCRRLGNLKEEMEPERLKEFVGSLLDRL